MRKRMVLMLCCMAMVLPAALKAQEHCSVERLYASFVKCSDAEHLQIGPLAMGLFKLIVAFNDEQGEEIEVLKKIRGVQILDLSDCSAQDRERFTKRAETVSFEGYELLMEMADEGDSMRIFTKRDNSHIKEFILLSYGEDPAMIRIKGSIPIKYLNDLIKGSVKEIK